MCIRGAGGLLQLLLRRVRLPEAQVVGNGTVEQVCVLGDDRHIVSERVQREIAEVMAAELDRAGLGIVEAVHQPDQRRLPCAAGAHDAKRLTLAKVEGYVLERRPVAAVVPEGNALEGDLRTDVGNRLLDRIL